MIERFYADNFRSLVNFDLRFGQLTLLLGENGSGKSSILEGIDRVVRYAIGELLIDTAFPFRDFTRWQGHVAPVQTFEIELRDQGRLFQYHLEIAHDPDRRRQRMRAERLLCDGHALFDFAIKDGTAKAQLYHDNFQQGPEVLADWSRSGVATIQSRPDNKLLTAFRERLAAVILARPAPQVMRAETVEPQRRPDSMLIDYPSWLAHLLHERNRRMIDVQLRLRDVMNGFQAFRLREAGDASMLHVEFLAEDGRELAFRFDELSDGERMLISLYTILGHLDDGGIVCLDEPENFLGLPEIQPWLDALRDRLEESEGAQAILVSHHPKLINFLANDLGVWIYRKGRSGPSQARRIGPMDGSTGLSVAKLVEMGWIYDAE